MTTRKSRSLSGPTSPRAACGPKEDDLVGLRHRNDAADELIHARVEVR